MDIYIYIENMMNMYGVYVYTVHETITLCDYDYLFRQTKNVPCFVGLNCSVCGFSRVLLHEPILTHSCGNLMDVVQTENNVVSLLI